MSLASRVTLSMPVWLAARTVIRLRDCSIPQRMVCGPALPPEKLRKHLLPRSRALPDAEGAVDDDRGRGHAVVERGRIDDRLEGRAGLALGLDGAVEIVAAGVEAALHGEDPAGRHLLDDHPALDLGNRAKRPDAAVALDRDHHSRAKEVEGGGAGAALGHRRGISGKLAGRAVGEAQSRALALARQHHRRPPILIADPERRPGQLPAPVAGDVDLEAGIAPALAPVVAHQPVAKRRLRRFLLGHVERGAHPQAARIDSVRPLLGLLAPADHQLAPHFLDEIAADVADAVVGEADGAERLGLGGGALRRR